MTSNSRLDRAADPESSKLSLRARKQEFVRDAIWAAAVRLFAEKGFEETTIDDVVEATGTSRRTFFRHFESKRDLMAQPVVHYGESLTRAIESCPPASSPAQLLHHVVLAVAERTGSDSRMRSVMEIAAAYPAAREAQLSRVAEVQDRLAETYARRCGDGVTAHVLAGLTLTALSLTYRVWFSEGNADIVSAARRVLAEISVVAGGQ